MIDMSRILFLCSRVPYPPTDGARVRMYNIADQLSLENEVELAILSVGDADQDAVNHLREKFSDVHLFEIPTYKHYIQAGIGLLSQKPIQCAAFRSSDLDRWLKKNENEFDIFYATHIATAEYILEKERNVLDFVDAMSLSYKEMGDAARGYMKYIYPIEADRLERYERSASKEFDKSFITSERERQQVISSKDDSVYIIQNGVDEHLLNVEQKYNNPGDQIVFIGDMSYPPNEDAALYFANEIQPKLESNHHVYFVGINPTKAVKALSGQNITVTGFVEDPSEYLGKADIAIAPMRYGGGIQNKVLEYMAAGLPAVLTPLAAEGIKTTEEEDLLIAEDSKAFADLIDLLISDSDMRRKYGESGRRIINRNYRWDTIGKRVSDLVSNLPN